MPTQDLLSRALHVMRRLDPAEAPLPGVLAAVPGIGTVVAIDAEALPDDWPGWQAGVSGHVWTPIDVIRRSDGHDALMPPCSERLDAFVARRESQSGAGPGVWPRGGLEDGERMTVAVSILRGFSELCTIDRPMSLGAWWLTDDGRPVFAGTASGETARDASAALLRTLASASTSLSIVLEEAADAITHQDVHARMLVAMEDRLFSIVAPAPLATASPGAARARAADPLLTAPAETAPSDEPRPSLLEHLGRSVDTDLADLVSRVTTALWRRSRTAPAPRGRSRPIIMGGTIAAAVIGIGMLWPAGGPATADGQSTPTPTMPALAASATTPPVAPEPAPSAQTPGASAAEAGEPVALPIIASDLLTARRACDGGPACLAVLQEDPTSALPPGAIDLAAAERTMTLVDEFGGAAVLRVDAVAGDQESQLIVIVQSGPDWLLRDVYDVAEQP